jgi:hypothetical protein
MARRLKTLARLLIVPGLGDSGPDHWQTWLQAREPRSLRVEQPDWHRPDLDAWASRVTATLEHAGGDEWIAVAHSFGCLAVVRHLQQQRDSPLRSVLLAAPADPERFGVSSELPQVPLAVPATWVASTDDPWMSFGNSQAWSQRWGCRWLCLGAAGHVNVEAGFGPWPRAAHWVRAARQQLQRARRLERADPREWSFSV